MKKALSILSILIIILMIFTSCNSVSEPPVVPSETSTPSETVKPTENPTEKPTEKPTETEPIVIPPREVTWDTTKYEAFYVPKEYLLISPKSLYEYYATLKGQEGAPVIPTLSLYDESLYESVVPPNTVSVTILGREYKGTFFKAYSFSSDMLRPEYVYMGDSLSEFLDFTVDENGFLLSFRWNKTFSNDLPLASLAECEESAKLYFSEQFPELDISEYSISSYTEEYSSSKQVYHCVVFVKSIGDIVEQEKMIFEFTGNGELNYIGHRISNEISEEIDISSIDIEDAYENFAKIAEYSFHVQKNCYSECKIIIPEDLTAVVLNDGTLAFHGEIEAIYKEGETHYRSAFDMYLKILP